MPEVQRLLVPIAGVGALLVIAAALQRPTAIESTAPERADSTTTPSVDVNPKPGGGFPDFGGGSAGGSRGEVGGGAAGGVEIVGQVVYGSAARAAIAEKIGIVDITRCFDVIPEYKEVRERNNTNATYYFYLRDVNNKFQKATAIVAREMSIPVVVEKGGVVGLSKDRIIDLTEKVIAQLKGA